MKRKVKTVKIDRGTAKRKTFSYKIRRHNLIAHTPAQNLKLNAKLQKLLSKEIKKIKAPRGAYVTISTEQKAVSEAASLIKERRVKIKGKFYAIIKDKSGAIVRKRAWTGKRKDRLRFVKFDEAVSVKPYTRKFKMNGKLRKLSDVKKRDVGIRGDFAELFNKLERGGETYKGSVAQLENLNINIFWKLKGRKIGKTKRIKRAKRKRGKLRRIRHRSR